MVQNVGGNLSNTFRSHKRTLAVDVPHILVVDIRVHIHGLDIVNTERQHVLVIDGIHDGVGMQLITKSLLCGAQNGVLAYTGIHSEDRRAGEAEQMILFEVFGDGNMHITKLTAVALVEDDNNALVKNTVDGILLDEGGELLDSSNNDAGLRIL